MADVPLVKVDDVGDGVQQGALSQNVSVSGEQPSADDAAAMAVSGAFFALATLINSLDDVCAALVKAGRLDVCVATMKQSSPVDSVSWRSPGGYTPVGVAVCSHW